MTLSEKYSQPNIHLTKIIGSDSFYDSTTIYELLLSGNGSLKPKIKLDYKI